MSVCVGMSQLRRQTYRGAFLAVLLCISVSGKAAEIEPLSDEGIVRLHGHIGDDTTFVKRFGLVAKTAVPELIFRPTELSSKDGKEQIGQQQLTLTSTGKLDLPQNTPKDVEIKITGVKLPGTYEGQLRFYRPNGGQTPELILPIEVIAEGTPSLTIRRGSDALKLQLYDCYRFGCTVASWLQPNAFVREYPLAVNNGSLEEFELSTAINATGELTHSSLASALTVNSPIAQKPEPVSTIPVAIKPAEARSLLPDHYVGDVQLRSGRNSLLSIPVDVNVRTGPLLPLVVLLLGVLLGRLLKYMKDKGGPQSDLLVHLYQLEGHIATAPDDQKRLQPMLDHVKDLIYSMELDSAKTEMTAVENRWTLLSTLRDLEQTLTPRKDENSVKAILPEIQQARNLIELKQDKQASDLVTKIEAEIQALVTSPPPNVSSFTLAARKAGAAKAVASRNAQDVTKPPKPTWYVRLLSLLTGNSSGALRAEVTLLVIRPVLYLLLVVALLVTGLQQLYLKNPTFGSDPLTDYFGLVVWAMSSDVASRTLSGLKSGAT